MFAKIAARPILKMHVVHAAMLKKGPAFRALRPMALSLSAMRSMSVLLNIPTYIHSPYVRKSCFTAPSGSLSTMDSAKADVASVTSIATRHVHGTILKSPKTHARTSWRSRKKGMKGVSTPWCQSMTPYPSMRPRQLHGKTPQTLRFLGHLRSGGGKYRHTAIMSVLLMTTKPSQKKKRTVTALRWWSTCQWLSSSTSSCHWGVSDNSGLSVALAMSSRRAAASPKRASCITAAARTGAAMTPRDRTPGASRSRPGRAGARLERCCSAGAQGQQQAAAAPSCYASGCRPGRVCSH
mmetsp:Transcript_20722/g.70502  ORF Transcript_20722/g.70502 Transcript_20722/m.70502 type:complete len:295 (-) Transcript_20722:119-1003(-)